MKQLGLVANYMVTYYKSQKKQSNEAIVENVLNHELVGIEDGIYCEMKINKIAKILLCSNFIRSCGYDSLHWLASF